MSIIFVLPPIRQRQTIAHELGHVILHLVPLPISGIDEDDEAFAFGSEFLMPLSKCQYDISAGLNIAKLADFKRIWKVSMASMVYKANRHQLLSANQIFICSIKCEGVEKKVNQFLYQKRHQL